MFRRAKQASPAPTSDARPALPDVPRPVPGVELNEVADGLVAYHGGTSQVHYLNATAAAIYVLADGTRSRRAIADEGAALFPGVADWPAVVDSCLADLLERGLLH